MSALTDNFKQINFTRAIQISAVFVPVICALVFFFNFFDIMDPALSKRPDDVIYYRSLFYELGCISAFVGLLTVNIVMTFNPYRRHITSGEMQVMALLLIILSLAYAFRGPLPTDVLKMAHQLRLVGIGVILLITVILSLTAIRRRWPRVIIVTLIAYTLYFVSGIWDVIISTPKADLTFPLVVSGVYAALVMWSIAVIPNANAPTEIESIKEHLGKVQSARARYQAVDNKLKELEEVRTVLDAYAPKKKDDKKPDKPAQEKPPASDTHIYSMIGMALEKTNMEIASLKEEINRLNDQNNQGGKNKKDDKPRNNGPQSNNQDKPEE
ncbi:MAG: hypothetical protein AAF512_23160 [Pseudomonadota bacterium]